MASPNGKSSYRRVTRRELLKLAPVAALGAFAVPALQPTLLNRGLAFTDWAAAAMVQHVASGPDVFRLGRDPARSVSAQLVRRRRP